MSGPDEEHLHDQVTSGQAVQIASTMQGSKGTNAGCWAQSLNEYKQHATASLAEFSRIASKQACLDLFIEGPHAQVCCLGSLQVVCLNSSCQIGSMLLLDRQKRPADSQPLAAVGHQCICVLAESWARPGQVAAVDLNARRQSDDVRSDQGWVLTEMCT